jgi:tRNA (guanine10-N2)-dimethyltransferase
MTEYIFILGKNWLLSIAEMIVYLRDQNLTAHVNDHSRNAAIVEIDERLSDSQVVEIQEALGGCFKIGRVITKYNRSVAERAFPKQGRPVKRYRTELMECPWIDRIWPSPKGKKIKFGVESTVSLKRLTLGLDEWAKRKLLARGARRAAYYIYEGPDTRKKERPNTALWPQTIARYNLLRPPNAEVLAVITEGTLYIGKTVVVYDSRLQQYRDESKPHITPKTSTSPKLCRTLITLAGAKPGDTILDPFCGSGTLLMEAAILGMKCIGIDIDGDAVQGARSNLRWLSSDLGEKLDFRIVKGDARRAAEVVGKAVDAIAFEPTLGPVYTKRPERKDAMTLPVINTTKGQVSVEFDQLIKGTNFELIRFLPRKSIRTQSTDKQIMIRPERRTIPERKMGQTVERTVVMLGKR